MRVGRISFGVGKHILGASASVWTILLLVWERGLQRSGGHEQTQIQLNLQSSGQKATHNIARLAVGLLLHGEERLAAQLGVAGHADKAVHVEDLVHGGAAGAFTHHVLPTAGTTTCRQGAEDRQRDENHKKNQKKNNTETLNIDRKEAAGRSTRTRSSGSAVGSVAQKGRRARPLPTLADVVMTVNGFSNTARSTEEGCAKRAVPRDASESDVKIIRRRPESWRRLSWHQVCWSERLRTQPEVRSGSFPLPHSGWQF